MAVKRLFVYTAFTFVTEKERKQGENGYRINYIRVWNCRALEPVCVDFGRLQN